MKKFNLIIFFFYILICPIHSIENLKFENITNKNGLSHNTVRCIMQDKRGFVWVSTTNGLNRYDGKEFLVMLPKFNSPSLTENKIRRTIEDKNGRIWIHLTSGFINCYDTHTESFVDYTGKNEVKRYEHIRVMSNGDVWLWGIEQGACRIQYIDDKLNPTVFDKNNIQTNTVNFVFEDSNQQIWIGTNRELYKVNQNNPEYCLTGDNNLDFHSAIEVDNQIYCFTKNSKIIIIDKSKKKFISEVNIQSQINYNSIKKTVLLKNNEILITTRQDTYIFNSSTHELTVAKRPLNGNEVQNANIITDNIGNYWLYNKSGNIWKYDFEKGKFEKMLLIPESILSVIDLERYDIYCDSRGIVWITTYGNGLFAIESNTGKINHFTTSNSDLKTNYLLSVTEDHTGEIWIGTEHTGITKISLTKYDNKLFFPDANKRNTENKIIRTIYQDNSGEIWIGTKSGNLYIYDDILNEKRILSLPSGMPYHLVKDTLNNLWIGTKGNGLIIFSENNNNYQNFIHNSLDTMSLTNNNIYSILKDSKGRMWIGTFGGGLLLTEKVGNDIQFIKIPNISKQQKLIRCLIQDSSGLIWVGGNNGVIVFDPDKIIESSSNFKSFSFDKNNQNSLNNNEVKVIFEDSYKQIWIGTSGGGLNIATKNAEKNTIYFKHYTSEGGLIDNVVQAIEEDNNKNLWISTENGVSKFNLETQIFENYNFSDSWESNLFCESSSLKTQNGRIMFGSHNGLYIFDPSSFENKVKSLSVTLTRLRINGIPVTPNAEDSPLSKSITESEKIKLKNGQNSFSIEFSSLNYQNAYPDRYTYILEGYDKDWNPITQFNVATYKNIPAGEYIFKVKGINSSGVLDDNETILKIIIVPPFWKSFEAVIAYFILILIAFFFAARLILKMNKLHNAVVIEKQLTEYRLRFFTNISHEFRTPLTIIKGSIENMEEMPSLPSPLRKQIKVLEKSSSRLMRLIDQLLEFRKLQKDTQELKLEYTDAVGFFHDIYNIFIDTANKNNINFSFYSNKDSKVILLDKAKMDKVLFNLLSNAFKHTPEQGHIKVELIFDDVKDDFKLKVSDSGIGIPQDKQDLLFQRFKQINYSVSGIGIGLHLTSELVSVHKGKIEYNHSEWNGASFTVTIPTSEDSYEKESIISTTTSSAAQNDKTATDNLVEISSEKLYRDYKILIIEDDEDIRTFLENQLENSFNILTASDGLKGLNAAIAEQPNLIICDVMMPEMDGFEVTKKLKGNFETSHIPIILLTAHTSMEHQVEGIEAGADSYIIKPFNIKYLITRIIKLIEQREKLQHKFSQEVGINHITITTTNRDKEFLEKVNVIIDKNLDNLEFSIEEFAKSVNLGRTMFYKKIKGITSYSPNEYVRIIRLKKAAELLKTTELNISEIAYKVGFNDPFYFSRCFKEQFDVTPTQFRNNKTDISNT